MRLNRATALIATWVIAGFLAPLSASAAPSSAPSPSPAASPSPSPQASARWNSSMQRLYQTLSQLLNDVSSKRRFEDPANRARIDQAARKLADLSHDLSKRKAPSDADPTVPIIAELMGRETKRAVQELKRDRGYARNLLRALPNYCIACHTRNSTGPQFSKLPFEPAKGSLSKVERGDFFTASRQFDRALQEFMEIVRDPKTARNNPWEWERAVQQSLAILVRVKPDPNRALELVQVVLDTPDAPIFLKTDARTWLSSIQEWKSETPRHAQTESGLHAEALRLMAKAREIQKYPMDRAADVFYLRASAAVHSQLQAFPQGVQAPAGLLLAGLSYEILRPLQLEELSDIYYELCILRAPHTDTASRCFSHYEESQYQGYTGSGGTHLPSYVRKRLAELRPLSEPAITAPQ